MQAATADRAEPQPLPAPIDPDRVRSEKWTCEFIGVPKPTRRRISDFPKPIRIGARKIGFIEAEVRAWVRARAAERVA
jgi:predicted DNA-binding transcriptional regulator AlpA